MPQHLSMTEQGGYLWYLGLLFSFITSDYDNGGCGDTLFLTNKASLEIRGWS